MLKFFVLSGILASTAVVALNNRRDARHKDCDNDLEPPSNWLLLRERSEMQLPGLIQPQGFAPSPPTNVFSLNWENKRAIQRVDEAVQLFGLGTPDALGKQNGGYAIWNNVRINGNTYLRWTIQETPILHDDPAAHADFFFLTIKFPVPVEKLLDVLGVSDSIVIYKLNSELSAGCHFRGAGVATLRLAIEVATGVKTKDEARDGYQRRIVELLNEENAALAAYYNSSDPADYHTPLADADEAYITQVYDCAIQKDLIYPQP